jgi:hypothetical protein
MSLTKNIGGRIRVKEIYLGEGKDVKSYFACSTFEFFNSTQFHLRISF